jgi:DNA-nicking Smr family endonuclease
MDVNALASLIKECDAREYTMIAATYGKGEGRGPDGIVAGHAYSLISFHEVIDQSNPV